MLNLLSHQRFMKKAETINAFTTAMPIATTIFHGSGIYIHVTKTVRKVSIKREVATPHKNLADDI